MGPRVVAKVRAVGSSRILSVGEGNDAIAIVRQDGTHLGQVPANMDSNVRHKPLLAHTLRLTPADLVVGARVWVQDLGTVEEADGVTVESFPADVIEVSAE